MIDGFIYLALAVFVGSVTQAMTGFGAMIISLTLAAIFFPIPQVLPVLLGLSIPQMCLICWQNKAHINWQLLGVGILVPMGLGMIPGLIIAEYMAGDALKIAFGVLIIALSTWQLYRMYASKVEQARMPSWQYNGVVFFSGIVHGIYASAGPMLAYAVTRLNVGKAEFRATLSMVWLSFNVMLTVAHIAKGNWQLDTVYNFLLLLPVVMLALFVGNRLHDKVDGQQFLTVVHIILIFSGITLLF